MSVPLLILAESSIGMVHDITERKQAEENSRTAKLK